MNGFALMVWASSLPLILKPFCPFPENRSEMEAITEAHSLALRLPQDYENENGMFRQGDSLQNLDERQKQKFEAKVPDMPFAFGLNVDSFRALTDEDYSPIVPVTAVSNIETQGPDAEAPRLHEHKAVYFPMF